jgi:hypothetical protein
MIEAMFKRQWGDKPLDRESSIAVMRANTERAMREVPRNRLLVWNASEGWEPICKALNLTVPRTPFPRSNTRADWRDRVEGLQKLLNSSS